MKRLFEFGLKKDGAGKDHTSGHSDNGCPEEIKGLSSLYCPQEQGLTHIRDVADVLSEARKITADQLSEIRQTQERKPDSDITEVIKDLKLADEPEISKARATLYGFEFRRIEPEQVDRETFGKLQLSYVKDNHIMPIATQGETLVVATSCPGDIFVIEDVKRLTGMNVEVVVCLDEDINTLCDAFDEGGTGYSFDDIISDMEDVEVVQDQKSEIIEDLEEMAGQSPVIKFVIFILSLRERLRK